MIDRGLNFFIPIIFLAFVNIAGCASTGQNATSKAPYDRDLVHGRAVYKVKKGDTLYSIGYRSGHGYRKLAKWNKIDPPYTVRIGQKIKLFAPKYSKRRGQKSSIWSKNSNKKRYTSQKKPILSTDNKNLLKLHWQWPIKGRIVKTFSKSGNKGIDISGQLGQSVRASESGKVVYSGDGLIGYGNLLIIKHDEMYLSAYANNSRLLVTEGQTVIKNQVVAKVGKGKKGQAKLHFEIRKYGKPVNPILYLPKM